MPRDLSQTILDVLSNRDKQNIFMCYDLTLNDGVTTIRGAETDLVVSSINLYGTSVAITPVVYEAKIAEDPTIGFYRQVQPSTGDLAINDVAHDLGVLVSQLTNVLDGASVVISKAFQKPDGTFELDVYFKAIVRDTKAKDDTVVLNLIRDVDSRTAFVARRSLTQRCLADYGDNRCGRPASMIAPGETCSNIFDDPVNGCLAKRWQFRYWGVPLLRLQTRNQNSNGGWGHADPTGGGTLFCPTDDQYVAVSQTMNKVISVKVSDLVEGMIVRDSLGRFALIDYLEYAEQPCVEIVASNGARLTCSESHPIIRAVNDLKGLAAGLKPTTCIGSDYSFEEPTRFETTIESITPIGTRRVRRICLSHSSTSLYDAGSDATKFITGHNLWKTPVDFMPV